MRSQIELSYYIGWDKEAMNKDGRSTLFESEVISEASALCGGCFVSDGTGYWIDGETHAERFSGTVKDEYCLKIILTCEYHKSLKVMEDMQKFITESCNAHDMPINWVHVQEKQITGHHFSVKADES